MSFAWWSMLRALCPAAWWSDGHGWRRRLALGIYDRAHAAAIRRLDRGGLLGGA